MFFFIQNMKEVYNATFQSLPDEIRSAHDGDVLSYLNGSLDILDLGCGTGLIGSWFKDYARKLVGVDVSPTMLDMATKKGCYHELRKGVSRRKENRESSLLCMYPERLISPERVLFLVGLGILILVKIHFQ